jgi:hypothetical protein
LVSKPRSFTELLVAARLSKRLLWRSATGTSRSTGFSKNYGVAFGMTDIEKQILDSLIELEAAGASMPTANPKPNLQPLFGRLDELARQLPKGTDPNLAHYLRQKSYQKARLFLEGRDAENAQGACGPR